MSGTSLDGLDIAYCEFEKNRNWKHKIIHAETKKYSKEWKAKLSSAFTKSKKQISKIDAEFGKFIGGKVNSFVRKYGLNPDFISSHGHTVFHRPDKRITRQIGSGKIISSICKLPVVCDFRSGDVALGGQGAPLVPIADKLLFSEYDFCLNLGGIANISFTSAPCLTGRQATPLLIERREGERRAFDICPVNTVLNDLANKLGKEFDRNGKIASKGKINSELLDKLNSLSFYKQNPPKSLGREWIEKYFFAVLNSFNISIQDKLRTVCEHIAIQVSSAVKSEIRNPKSEILITGGGAYNKFLIRRIEAHSKCKVILPDDKTIQFKEAMAFAFLGVLKMRNEINILKSVTGAANDSSGGKIYAKRITAKKA